MKQVIFSRHFELFNANEIAGFSDEKAAQIVAGGFGRYYPLPEPALEIPAVPAPDMPVVEPPMEPVDLDLQKELKKAPLDKMVKDAKTK